jgi:hypothetical protein
VLGLLTRALAYGCLTLASACTSSIEGPPTDAESGGLAGVGASSSGSGTSFGGNVAGGTSSKGGSSAGGMSGAPNGGSNAGGSGSSAGSSSGGNAAGGAVVEGPATLLPARIRRLANAEYDASVHQLLSTSASPASGSDFPPDFRQNGFTLNEAQRVDSIIVQRLFTAAETLAAEAKQNGTLARLAPCTNTAQAAACASTFITSFGAKIYRRSLTDEEISALLALYDVGAEGASYEDGIAHTLRGLLQSAGFLYLTELGSGTPAADGSLALTSNELAASLSYFLTAAPPDEQLLQKAVAGSLADPAEREAQARRLLQSSPLAQDAAVRLVREWLGIDRIANSSKDSLIYPNFEAQKTKIVAESSDFVKAVTFQSTGAISELLGAAWTVNSGPLSLYTTAGNGPIGNSTKLTDRIGILNQAAFLATYANAHESHPVFRGVAIARRVTCLAIASPTTLNIQVVPPVPDPKKTTRQRFDIHSTDAACKGCHHVIDPFGFSFEQFDGMGAYRAKENGLDVNSSVTIALSADFDGDYTNSNDLAKALSQSESVRTCFARFMYRAASASTEAAAGPGEDAFVRAWKSIPAAAQGGITETLVAYVKSPSFAARRAQ